MTIVVEKVVHQWPLSKVELVNRDGQKLIRKSVHIDFKGEIDKQRAIRKAAKSFLVPEIIDVEETGELAVFLMEYFEPMKKSTQDQAEQLIKIFHEETKDLIKSNIFDVFKIDNLTADLETATIYGEIPPLVKTKSFFDELFDGNSILHGDWGIDQIIQTKNGPVIIDFGKTLVGPTILDYAHNIRFNRDKCLVTNNPRLSKALIAVDIMRMAWFDFCRNNYIDYSYEKEMQESINTINNICSVIIKTE